MMDSSDFDKKFAEITKRAIPQAIERGMGKAMLDLLNDCIMEVPTVPLKDGFLRGSGSVFVQNKLAGTSEAMAGAKGGTPVKSYSKALNMGEYEGLIGFNTVYAAKLHEGIDFTFTEPSAGPKFLESKLQRKRKHYMSVIANTIRSAGNA